MMGDQHDDWLERVAETSPEPGTGPEPGDPAAGPAAGVGAGGRESDGEGDANDLDVDNAVEADTVETLDPENPPV